MFLAQKWPFLSLFFRKTAFFHEKTLKTCQKATFFPKNHEKPRKPAIFSEKRPFFDQKRVKKPFFVEKCPKNPQKWPKMPENAH